MERISVPPQFQTLIEERLEGQALRRLLTPAAPLGPVGVPETRGARFIIYQ